MNEQEALIPIQARAPAPRKAPAPRQPVRSRSGTRQLSLFGAEAGRPEAADLAGLLAGPGQVVRMGGTARVSIVVDDRWRAEALVAELGRRRLLATWSDLRTRRAPARELTPVADPEAADDEPPEKPGTPKQEPEPPAPEESDARFEVHTAYTAILNDLAAAWLDGTTKRAPADLLLDGRALRLWTLAAGRPHEGGYLLGADAGAEDAAVGAALARTGLAPQLTDRPGYVVIGQRLAELVGEPPKQAPPGLWPS